MSTDRLHAIIAAAQAEGLLPESVAPVDIDSRPWPVVLLTALGAWLAAVPLLIVMGFLFGDSFSNISTIGVMGALLIVGSVVVLRSREIPLFFEQLAVPGLIVGVGLVAWMLANAQDDLQVAAALLFPLLLGLSATLPQTWLRALLGAAAAVVGGFTLVE
jgi:hypothetical protein